ncbi:MAG: metal ABC transporter permease [Lentisphaerae bacterium]|jgi:ABC-type Mn2+/Zn2+ transport system permease subunit|nr:metal ABC transporter permease [Lentisphaerota bacterium]
MWNSFLACCTLFPKAMLCGVIMAISCGVFGVFVLLHRVVFISIALTECAACGIAAAALWHFHPFIGATAACLLAVLFLSMDWDNSVLPRDAILGALYTGAAALSVLLVSRSGMGLLEVKAMLYGDLILASDADLWLLLLVQMPLLCIGLLFLKPLLYTFLDRNAARLMGIPVKTVEFLFFLGLGLVVSAAGKIGGALLVFCLLVVPPAGALLLSRRLLIVLSLSAILGVLATLSGLTWAFHQDLPGNQCIVVVSCSLLAGIFLAKKLLQVRLKRL